MKFDYSNFIGIYKVCNYIRTFVWFVLILLTVFYIAIYFGFYLFNNLKQSGFVLFLRTISKHLITHTKNVLSKH